MSTRGGTRATLYRVIAEKDAEIARLTARAPSELLAANHALILARNYWRETAENAEQKLKELGLNQDTTTPIVRGSKVRRIDEPYVVLHVREVDSEGKIDGSAKVLCFNSFGAGRWMLLSDLEVIS